MEHILARINALYPLPEQSLQQLTGLLTRIELPKGQLLFKSGRISRELYFIDTGIARAYLNQNDREITFWFGEEGDVIISFNGYVNNAPGYEDVELLENAVLYRADVDELEKLYRTDIALANWGRKLAEKELIATEERLIARQFKTATECYRELLKRHPQLLRRVQLGHIASYLGITQVTLSRIRADMKY